jgi:micrococcal nuclease
LPGACTIERVIDGDTLLCRQTSARVRLLLIDAPESGQGEYGRQAADALRAMLPVGTVARVELDVQERDRYGRILAYLYTPAGRMVNQELARLGFALVAVYPPNVRHVDSIRSAVEEARQSRRGLWAGSAFECAPVDHRAGRC